MNPKFESTEFLIGEYVICSSLSIEDLKQEFIAEIKKDIFENAAYKSVISANEKLKQQGYDAQVTPREINIFYTDKHLRERIVKENETYKVLNTDISFSKEEIEKLIDLVGIDGPNPL